jgi:hypothetical protein
MNGASRNQSKEDPISSAHDNRNSCQYYESKSAVFVCEGGLYIEQKSELANGPRGAIKTKRLFVLSSGRDDAMKDVAFFWIEFL